jgi:hypothetical protein
MSILGLLGKMIWLTLLKVGEDLIWAWFTDWLISCFIVDRAAAGACELKLPGIIMGSYHVEPVPFLGMKSLRIELILASYRVALRFTVSSWYVWKREKKPDWKNESEEKFSWSIVQQHANHPVLQL